MYQNMRVPVITGSIISNSNVFGSIAEIKHDGEVVSPVFIGSVTDNSKYGILIEYGNYLYIENKPNSGYSIKISFIDRSLTVKIINPGNNYTIQICCTTFVTIEAVSSNEIVETGI